MGGVAVRGDRRRPADIVSLSATTLPTVGLSESSCPVAQMYCGP